MIAVTMPLALIMRGVPGSGKSTVARKLVGEEGIIHSTDRFFYKNGVFEWDPSLLPKYHDRNYMAFCASLDAGISPVICDNTNVQFWEYERYVNAARNAGYLVAIVVMPHPDPQVAAARTIHGVSAEDIQEMLAMWEK